MKETREIRRLRRRLKEIEEMVCVSNSAHLGTPKMDQIKVGQLLTKIISKKIGDGKEEALETALHDMKIRYEESKMDRFQVTEEYTEMMHLFIDLLDALKGTKAHGDSELIIPNAMLFHHALKPLTKKLNRFLEHLWEIGEREEEDDDGR